MNQEDTKKNDPQNTIAFQGELGANSHIACNTVYPEMAVLPCTTFEGAFRAVQSGRAALAMMPVENTVAGRVADIHRLLPGSGLFVIGEHFMRVSHALLGVPSAKIDDIKFIHSHEMALGQCRHEINALGAEPVIAADTAGSAREIAEKGDPNHAAIATELAADIYGLQVMKSGIEDAGHNTTRFLVMSQTPDDADPDEENVVTSFIFRVRNVPAALYKALGGFASNGINMTKLESYQIEGSFQATMFYADIEGHPETESVRLAMEELNFFCSEVTVLGVYKAADFRRG